MATGTAKNSLWLSFSLSFWIFLAIARLEFWVFYWVCWGFCCLGLLRFLFNFFCLGFCCWMHRMFGVFVKFFGWWICYQNSLCVCDLNSFTLLLELWVCLWWSLFLFILIFLGFCSTLILLIVTNFLKDFHSSLLSMVYDIFGCVLSGIGYFIDI